ncbi:DUF2922 domain-containing protein [Oceanirhabdus sp. W0125-5]|uniref:DUF2922 domain-containing protein n=1 Tax=Oceanirhabdus sp. W0125-5 TaxID=2999116 RepID=UPI0022F2E625|nr:DUF2922 domain-containing protein [Oceanirhabdus sp. W0125-5]WBW96371.1 DUF2922 domain-containing protein [Oceanirhabdus sp. W0125-5]
MKKLSMKFVTASDDITTLTINEVREDISDAEVNSLMDEIITQNVFYSTGGSLVKKKNAKVIDVTESEVTLA